MSKVNKVLLIIGTACVVLGAVVGTCALAFAQFDYRAFSTAKPYESHEFVSKDAKIDTIEFAGISDNVRVQYGPVKTVTIDYWQNKDNYYTISESREHTLKMELNNGRKWLNLSFGFSFEDFEERDVLITIPESFEGSLKLKTVSGDTFVDAPSSLETLDIDTVSGNVHFSCGDVASVLLNGVSGQIDFTSEAIGLLNINTLSGNVDFSSGPIKQLGFDSLSGNVEGRVADDAADYTIKTNTLSGRLDVPNTTSKAKNSMSFDTTSGNVRIDFDK